MEISYFIVTKLITEKGGISLRAEETWKELEGGGMGRSAGMIGKGEVIQ